MNLWKISTFVLASALAVVAGKDATPSAEAAVATSGALEGASQVAFDWAKDQPNMDRAAQALMNARAALQAASEHKGGWRAKALDHCNAAISDTQAGIEYAKSHPKG